MKKNEEENWTSVSTGYATFSAEDISHYDKSDNTTPDNMLLSGDVRYYGNSMNWESTKGDLISREALKKKFERLVDETIPYGGVAVNDMRELIDNAPTVEPEKVKESELIKAYTKGFDTGVETVKNEMTQDLIDKVNVNVGLAQPIKDERPQGKWGKWVISEIRCPNCLEYFQTDCYSMEELKKCPNCGADMKGGAEE